MYKGVNIREIDTYGFNETQERVKWEKFADKHYLDKTFSSTVKKDRPMQIYRNIKTRNNKKILPNVKTFNNIRRNKTTSFSNLLYNI